MKQEELDLLKQIADGKTLTQYDKNFIKQASADNDIPFTPKGNCGNCYRDQAVILYKAMKKEVSPADGRKYHLPVGVQVNFLGMTIKDADLTDTLAESLIERGLSADVFAK